MRRVLTILTAILLLIVSLGIGLFTADLPFWRRAFQLPLPEGEVYLPRASLGPTVNAAAPLPSGPAPFDALLVDEAVARARQAGSRALLVLHRGQLVVERYFVTDDAASLLPATLVARPLAAMAIGVALRDGKITSLDTPLSGFLHEWEDDPRGRITLRQLLEETSGLETGGAIQGLLHRSPWRDYAALPEFATSRGVRMLLGNDYQSSALRFRLDHEPGGFYNVSPANTQLVAVILERVTGTPYETFIDEHLWRAVGAGLAEMQLDRRAGMPAAHCCWRATARDMLRVASLLASDGRHAGRQVLPEGWVQEMSRPSRVNADTGLQLRRLQIEGHEAIAAADEDGSAFWVIASRGLVVLSISGQGGRLNDDLPAMLVKGLAGP
jgi:CubicO group peptidase (beta-lactamase class C family)